MKRWFPLFLVLLLAFAITACSSSEDLEITPIPPTELPSPPTVTPGGTTVGSLIDLIASSWVSVSSLQTTFWSQEGEAIGSPPSSAEVTVESVVAPSSRHVVRSLNGVVVEEQMAVDGRVYMKGQIVVAAIAPMMGTDTWVEVDPAAATSTAAIAAQVDWLLSPIESPFAMVSSETRMLEAFPGESIEVNGRHCNVWLFGTAEGITQELAIDEQSLPCRLVQRAGGYTNVTLYEPNPTELKIVAPEIATPTVGD